MLLVKHNTVKARIILIYDAQSHKKGFIHTSYIALTVILQYDTCQIEK